MIKFRLNVFVFLFANICIFCRPGDMKLDRVIVTSDKNKMYLDFWPIVANAWKQLIGVKPTLILIDTEEGLKVDETLGDVIRLKPIEGVPTAQHAQIIRAFAPMLFPDEVCMISDIDILPISKSYFDLSFKKVPSKNHFVVFRNRCYEGNRYPMCFLAGKGSVYKEILGVEWHQVEDTIKQWMAQGYGWDTDEMVFTQYIKQWERFGRCYKLGYGFAEKRIDRSKWVYSKRLLRKGYYAYSHMIRPYSKRKKELDELFNELGLEI